MSVTPFAMKTCTKETPYVDREPEDPIGKNQRVIFRILGAIAVVALLCTVIVGAVYTNDYLASGNAHGEAHRYQLDVRVPIVEYDSSEDSLSLLSLESVQAPKLFLSTTSQSWSSAEANCQSHSGHLVSIGSVTEVQRVSDFGQDVWIGLEDRNAENHFSWPDGTPFVYSNWDSGEPNNMGDEDCVIQKNSGVWNDGTCSVLMQSVCEVFVVRTYFSTAKSWNDAEADCVARGWHLASIHSEAENDAVREISGGAEVHIGYHDQNSESNFVWSDHIAASYTNWAGGEPNDNNNEDCTLIRTDGSWNDVPCSFTRGYVCEYPFPLAYVATSSSWITAEPTCRSKGPGSYLVSIHSEAEQQVVKHFSTGADVYIGLNDLSSEGNFVWTDGTSLYYQNWHAGEPNDVNGEDCVHMKGDGSWNDINCAAAKHAVCSLSSIESCGNIEVYGMSAQAGFLNGVYEHLGEFNNHPYYKHKARDVWLYYLYSDQNSWDLSSPLGNDQIYAYCDDQAARPELITAEWHVGQNLAADYNVGTRCEIDECATKKDNCDTNAICTDNMPGFTCTCQSGYTGDGTSCTDIDECATGQDNCDTNAICVNVIPYFTCTCQPGFSGDGISCTDVDECALGQHDCDANANCVNTVPGFTCICHSGYTGDGGSCTDIDECETGPNDCDTNAICANLVPGYTCTCPSGYTGDGTTCTDIDECMTGVHNCDDNASCENDVPDFLCTCNPGYTGDGTSCTDIDECATGQDNCDANASCENAVPGFICTCHPGFTGDGTSCTDVDECATGQDNCGANASCENAVPGFECTCDCRYVGDGLTCAADKYYTVKQKWINCYLGPEVLKSHSETFPGAYMSTISIAACISRAKDNGYNGFTARNVGSMHCDFFMTPNFDPLADLNTCTVVAEADLASTLSPTSYIISDVCHFSYTFTGTSTYNDGDILMFNLEGQLDIHAGQLAPTSSVKFALASDGSFVNSVPLIGHWSQSGILLSVAPTETFTFTYEGPDVEDIVSETVVLWSTNEGGYTIERQNGWDWQLHYVGVQ